MRYCLLPLTKRNLFNIYLLFIFRRALNFANQIDSKHQRVANHEMLPYASTQPIYPSLSPDRIYSVESVRNIFACNVIFLPTPFKILLNKLVMPSQLIIFNFFFSHVHHTESQKSLILIWTVSINVYK